MPFGDPLSIDVDALFRDVGMFESRKTWTAAGFRVVDRSNNGKIMVASHPSVRGLLFKKYASDISLEDQHKNYERRIEGARRLRSLVDARRLRHVAVPRKWLVELPRAFSRRGPSHVLVVEQLDVLDDDQTAAAYRQIDPGVLAELCFVVFRFRGMDSNTKNIPFVADGRIAFIDTEHWDRGSSKSYLHHINGQLSSDRRKMAKRIFEQLEDGEDAVRRDFDGEEDTSPSSSSSSPSSS